jgi:uncharacterized membrane protein YkvA (DUF1232 family)
MRSKQSIATTLKASVRQAFQQFRIILRAVVHPEVPWYAKLVCGCTVLYVTSPIQIIPNFIPILGQMDDVLLVGLSIKLLKRSTPPGVLEDCRNGSRKPLPSAIAPGLPICALPDLES